MVLAIYRAKGRSFSLLRTNISRTTPIDIRIILTLYKNVIIFQRGRNFVILARLLSDSWRYHSRYCRSRIPVHAEFRSESGLGAPFQRISGETRGQYHV
jgi:hypothetical protein